MTEGVSTRRSAWGFDTDRGLDWRDLALCAQVDAEIFFPEKGGSTREAKRVCMGCEVRAECLDEALATDERFGVRGGFSERERRKLKRGELVELRIAQRQGTRICGHCGGSFHGHPNSRYCSNACRVGAECARRAEKHAMKPRTCGWCGTEFEGRPQARFCSTPCRRSGKRAARARTVACEQCGEEFSSTDRRQRFCGQSCRTISYRERTKQSDVRFANAVAELRGA